ncbi:MAG: hypothetical protein RMM98_18240 [Acidobacteriota bacterium]|nr:hypothetical protein [Blastocatellia bacterium]MDW8241546.1 hypothetical protein [Acidobacteriota bacterium]
MIETLMTRYIIALIYRDTRANCVEVAECFEGLSHDPFSRMLGEVRCWPTRLWQDFARRLIGEGGYLLLDDTVRNGGNPCLGFMGSLLHDWARWCEGSTWYCPLWTDGQRRVPLG